MFRRFKLVPLLLCLVFIGYGHAQEEYFPNTDTYIVGLPSFLLNSITADGTAIQEKEFWCWAAVSQALLELQGIKVSQHEIVTRIMGAAIDEGATREQMRRATDGYIYRVNGQYIRTRSNYVYHTYEIIQSLRDGNPLIVGFSGHAYALTAAEYRRHYNGSIEITRVVLRDPWGSNPNRQEWDFENIMLQDNLTIIRMDLENL